MDATNPWTLVEYARKAGDQVMAWDSYYCLIRIDIGENTRRGTRFTNGYFSEVATRPGRRPSNIRWAICFGAVCRTSNGDRRSNYSCSRITSAVIAVRRYTASTISTTARTSILARRKRAIWNCCTVAAISEFTSNSIGSAVRANAISAVVRLRDAD